MSSKINCSPFAIHQLILCIFLTVILLYSFIYVHPWHDRPMKLVIETTVIDNRGSYDNIDGIALVDELMSPPRKVKVKERINWFIPRLKKSKILESTAKTRDFHNKIIRFFSPDINTRCKVRFFMTWISPNKLFGKRELLSLESVFSSHPNGCVVILSKSMDSEPGWKILEPLISRGYRVLPADPDFQLLFNNTPAKGWLEKLESGLIDPGAIPITQNLSNLLRLVALYKYGGIYVDTDVIILKDFSSLRNSIGVQTVKNKAIKQWTTLNNAVLIFDKGHPMLLKFINEFGYSFNGNKWGYNGPALVTRVVFRRNRDKRIKVNVLPPMAFYPVDWIGIVEYFRKVVGENETEWARDQLHRVDSNSYAIHLWNKDTRELRIENGSVIGRLISDQCIVCQNIYTSRKLH